MAHKKQPKNRASNLQRKAAQLLRAQKVVELKAQGLSYSAIGERLGIKGGKGAVCKLWQAARAEVVREDVEQIRELNGVRIEEAFNVVRAIYMNPATQPDMKLHAVNSVVPLIKLHVELYGCKAPPRSEVTGRNGGPILTADLSSLSDEQLERIIAGDTSAFTGEGGAGEP